LSSFAKWHNRRAWQQLGKLSGKVRGKGTSLSSWRSVELASNKMLEFVLVLADLDARDQAVSLDEQMRRRWSLSVKR